jgi:hypothetical protein
VGQVADQLLVRLRLLQQAVFAVLSRLLLQRPQLHDQLIALPWRHVHMHRQGLLVQALEACLVAQGLEVLAARPGERCLQQGGFGKTH